MHDHAPVSPRQGVLLVLLATLLVLWLGERGLALWDQAEQRAMLQQATLIEHALWLRGEAHALAAAEAAWVAFGRGEGLSRIDRRHASTEAALQALQDAAEGERARARVAELSRQLAEMRARIERLQRERALPGPRVAGPSAAGAPLALAAERFDAGIEALLQEAHERLRAAQARVGTLRLWNGLLWAAMLPLLLLQLLLLHLEARSRRRAENEQRRLAALAEQERCHAERVAGDLDRLAGLADQLRPTRSVEEIAEVLQANMHHLLQFHGALYLRAPQRNLLRRHAAWGKPAVPLEDLFTLEDCWALRRGTPYPSDPQAPPCRHLAAGTAPGHVLCVPLLAQGEPLGLLHLSGEVAPGPRERRLAQCIADLLALSIHQLRLAESLRVQSVRDPVTGLLDRRHIDASLLRECLRARRAQQQLGVLLLDLDDFKHFNERHGHEAGDAALAQIGQLIAQTVRPEDVAGRHGGEEFLILIPDCDLATAKERAERLRHAIRATPIDLHGRRVEALRCSIGVALYPLHGKEPAICLRAADRAVRAAKVQGRDRIVVAEAPAAPTADPGTATPSHPG